MSQEEGYDTEVYDNKFEPYIITWGRRLNLFAVLLSLGPALALLGVFGVLPPSSAIIGGFISVAGAFGAFWIVEPVSYYPVLGIPGTYMSFLAGNISNMRLPCSAAAQEAADVEIGTPEGSIISTIGIAGSILVNISILTIGVLALTGVFQQMPELWKNALQSYLVPAIFGAIFAQFGRDYPKVAVIAFAIAMVLNIANSAGVFSFMPGTPLYVVIIGSVFGTMFISRWMWQQGMIEGPE